MSARTFLTLEIVLSGMSVNDCCPEGERTSFRIGSPHRCKGYVFLEQGQGRQAGAADVLKVCGRSAILQSCNKARNPASWEVDSI